VKVSMDAELAVGRLGEDKVIEQLNGSMRGFAIRLTHMQLQRDGYDILFCRVDGCQLLVQVKHDVRAAQTGNIFWETGSHGKAGWGARPLDADWYVWVVGDSYYWLPRESAIALQQRVQADSFRMVHTATACGALVPITEMSVDGARKPPHSVFHDTDQ